MKLYLIAALFLATLVVVPCLAEEELKNAAPANVADVPEDKPVEMGGGGSTAGDEEQKDEEQKDVDGGGTEGDEEQKDEEQSDEEEKEEAEPADDPIPEEFKDEVEQVKRRRFPQLSHHSCMILKRYRYCRYSYIKRFCVRQCGRCQDKLSRPSCYKVRHVFKQCRHHIGRVYCKKTCGHCGLPAQCRRHRVINDITRRQSRHRGNLLLCDNKITVGWYRFVGNTGTYIPNRCVASNRCGTHAPGWVVGNYPTVRGQNVRRQVCFKWKNNCCYNARWWRVYINITNCGNYYVFYLTRPRNCYYRYCGNR